MSDSDNLPQDPSEESTVDATDNEETTIEEPQKLTLEVDINEIGPCQRQISVSVSHEDVDRFFDDQFSEIMPDAEVPGFRPGHAPRKLVEKRFRRQVGERVKADIVMQVLEQVGEDYNLAAISEPDFDYDNIDIPEEGPMKFEFELEVRPDFELPQWKGLKIRRPTKEFTDEDINGTLDRVMESRGSLEPHEGAAEANDYIVANLTFHFEDELLSHGEEETIRIRPTLSFHDGQIEKFDELMAGVTGGETRKAEVVIAENAVNQALRGKTVQATFEILEVKRLQTPELDETLLEELGNFETEADLKDAIGDQLTRRMEYEQQQIARDEILKALTEAANWDLPPDLLERQSRRELQRAILEMRHAGLSEEDIRARENLLRQNSRAETARALKEHFILERIAEEQELDVTDEEYEMEIMMIAYQQGQSPRRVRAQLEKSNSMDVLRNQIIERKVVAIILEEAEYVDEPYEVDGAIDVTALDQAASGRDTDIPEAKPEHEETNESE